MTATLGTEWALDWVARAATAVSEHRIDLIELDRAIGDGDHGENMDRGFTAVTAKLAATRPESAGEVLKTVATTLMSTVGGAAGPLYGTAFLRGAKAADGELDAAGVAAVLEAALEGIRARGKAETGEKTMVDAWTPAAEAARAAADAGRSPVEALRAAADAAAAGADATVPMVATKGRASYLGERSAGHRDPGAESSSLLLAAAAEAAEAR
ncbi:dihydroxyacetone kinase subunit DhaL [Georgenia yuyongxinii]|uniref:Dihydroxyacetone kinase subunit L n=1 Tax=Georgenia yuyongxinii TaxID=2589797 RepID=A0A552WRC7_9MICO|nr:dihydroxyacetone kinase subunit DhaL [Georgenia yuyongxinii]TRW45274.1 dihydroxyacetone kinase subunit L [Georgenia yuyongxinii]